MDFDDPGEETEQCYTNMIGHQQTQFYMEDIHILKRMSSRAAWRVSMNNPNRSIGSKQATPYCVPSTRRSSMLSNANSSASRLGTFKVLHRSSPIWPKKSRCRGQWPTRSHRRPANEANCRAEWRPRLRSSTRPKYSRKSQAKHCRFTVSTAIRRAICWNTFIGTFAAVGS